MEREPRAPRRVRDSSKSTASSRSTSMLRGGERAWMGAASPATVANPSRERQGSLLRWRYAPNTMGPTMRVPPDATRLTSIRTRVERRCPVADHAKADPPIDGDRRRVELVHEQADI